MQIELLLLLLLSIKFTKIHKNIAIAIASVSYACIRAGFS